MSLEFKKASRGNNKLRIALSAPSGFGKTFSAMRLAAGMKLKTAVLDTEAQSANLYADKFDFDVLQMNPPYSTDKYVAAIKAAEEAGYEVMIIDSLSHAWIGEGGTLDKKNTIDAQGGNSFTNWAKVNPGFHALIEAILRSKMHIICTIRAKVEHVIEKDSSGRTTVKKLGLAPQFRDGLEYEFTSFLDLDDAHNATSTKDRTGIFTGRVTLLTEEVGKSLRAWADGGVPTPPAN